MKKAEAEALQREVEYTKAGQAAVKRALRDMSVLVEQAVAFSSGLALCELMDNHTSNASYKEAMILLTRVQLQSRNILEAYGP